MATSEWEIPAELQPSPADHAFDLDEALRSIVAVKCMAPPDAFTAQTLGTERAGSSPLNAEKRPGTFLCAACDQALFRTEDKFESGTGWPSFTQPLAPEAVGTTEDRTLWMVRTEVHCSNCGGHLGHVFRGEGFTEKNTRHCVNSLSIRLDER